MLSSLVWLFMVVKDYIDVEKAPWIVYIPVVIIEMALYTCLLPKFCDWIDSLGKE